MGNTDNWRTETTAEDFFTGQKKRQNIESRRMVIRKASDLVGPGIAASAIRITDFNDLLATFNGYYSAIGDEALNGPVSDHTSLVGYVVSDADLGGFQVFTAVETLYSYQRSFTRAPYAPESITWGDWIVIDDGSGGPPITDLKGLYGTGVDQSGADANAGGNGTTASGDYSLAEGNGTIASGDNSHAEGRETVASGDESHAEGSETTASGASAHAEGDATTASGQASHAEGNFTFADGPYSHIQGDGGRAFRAMEDSTSSQSPDHTLQHTRLTIVSDWPSGDIHIGGGTTPILIPVHDGYFDGTVSIWLGTPFANRWDLTFRGSNSASNFAGRPSGTVAIDASAGGGGTVYGPSTITWAVTGDSAGNVVITPSATTGSTDRFAHVDLFELHANT